MGKRIWETHFAADPHPAQITTPSDPELLYRQASMHACICTNTPACSSDITIKRVRCQVVAVRFQTYLGTLGGARLGWQVSWLRPMLWEALCPLWVGTWGTDGAWPRTTGFLLVADFVGDIRLGREEGMKWRARAARLCLLPASKLHCCDTTVCMSVPGGLDPRGVDRWRYRGGVCGGGDLSDDGEGLLQGCVLAEHFLPVLPLLRWLIHQCWAFFQSVELGQELRANELLHLQRGGL